MKTASHFKSSLFFLVFIYTPFLLFAQGENNIWYFGENAGLDFNGGGTPVPISNGAMIQSEGCASVCDANGNLLFYTNGVKVWNRNHQVMTNGTGLLGHQSSTQSVVVVSNCNLYYVFTTNALENINDGLRYSIVDMSQSGGLGAVTVKNILLLSNSTEKLTTTPHANGLDTWIIGHDQDSTFYAWLLTLNGVSPTPITSSLGFSMGNSNNFTGAMKVSPDGSKLLLNRRVSGVELFSFNKSAGTLSNHLNLIPWTAALYNYGAEFSPNSSKLYVGRGAQIHQFDLSAGSNTAIINSNTIVSSNIPTGQEFFSLQLGPNNKVYAVRSGIQAVDVIHNPNIAGVGCNYNFNAIPLATNTSSYLGLPQKVFGRSNILPSLQDTIICLGASLVLDPGVHASYLWSTGATSQTITVNAPGIYWVDVTSSYGCTSRDSVHISGMQNNNILGNDTAICGDSLLLDPGSGYSSYLWSTGATTQSIIASLSGTYWVEVTAVGGCPTRDTVDIILTPYPLVNLGSDTVLCDSASLVLNSGVHSSYIWSTGSINPVLSVNAPGIYWVEVTDTVGCSSADTVTIHQFENILNTLSDTTICNGSVLLDAGPGFSSYLWSNGSTTQTVVLNSTGIYWLEVTGVGGCSQRDSITFSSHSMIVELGNDTTVCFGSTLVIDAFPNSPNHLYRWDIYQSIGYIPLPVLVRSVNTFSANWYSVEVINTINGCYGIDSILISTFPRIFPRLGNDTSFCDSNFSLTLNPGTFTSYLWSNGATTSTILATNPGQYWVETTDTCGFSARDSINVTVNPIPVIDLGNDTVICNGGNLQLNAPMRNITNYDWSGPILSNGNNNISSSVTINIPGSYAVEVTDGNGCMGADTITVSPPFQVQLPRDTILCPGERLRISAANRYITEYRWSGPILSNSSNVSSIVVNQSGTYTVQALDRFGCISSDDIRVDYLDELVVGSLEDGSYCPNNNIPIILTTTNIPGASYQWNIGSSATWTNPAPQTGTYIVAVNLSNCTVYDSAFISEQLFPDNIGSGYTICPGDSLLLDRTINNPFYPCWSFKWYRKDNTGAIITLGTDNELAIAPTMSMMIYTHVEDICTGCSKSDSTFINVLSPNDRRCKRKGDTGPSEETKMGSVLDNLNLQMTIYPNPNNGLFNISYSSLAKVEGYISILNYLGQEVYGQRIISSKGTNNKELSLEYLTSGVYFIQLQVGNQMLTDRFLVK